MIYRKRYPNDELRRKNRIANRRFARFYKYDHWIMMISCHNNTILCGRAVWIWCNVFSEYHWSLLYTSDTWVSASSGHANRSSKFYFFIFYACHSRLLRLETLYTCISVLPWDLCIDWVYTCAYFFDERWRWPAWKDDQYIQPVNFTLSMQSISWFHVEDPVYSTLHKKSTSIFNLSTLCCPCSLFYGLLNISGCVHCQAAVRPI